jgi:hypothetical protein
MLEQDGLIVFLGYVFILGTIVYFGVLIAGAIAAGVGLTRIFRPG